jgi:hypothetical protein
MTVNGPKGEAALSVREKTFTFCFRRQYLHNFGFVNNFVNYRWIKTQIQEAKEVDNLILFTFKNLDLTFVRNSFLLKNFDIESLTQNKNIFFFK